MLARRIVACLDVSHGQVVKGVNFTGLQRAGDPRSGPASVRRDPAPGDRGDAGPARPHLVAGPGPSDDISPGGVRKT